MTVSKLKFSVFLYLSGMVMIHAAVVWSVREQIRKGYSDFSIYYCAGTIVRQGQGRQLYDSATQFNVQRAFSPQATLRVDALPYNHPPFEALLFAPLAYLDYPSAFALWALANLAMLLSLPFLLQPELHHLRNYPWPLWILAALAFFPIFLSLLQGQDAILLLFLYTLAFVCLRKKRDLLAGLWLALGLFKPHLILPFLFLLLVQGRKKVLYGALPMAAILVGVSLAVVGWEGCRLYPRYVLHLESTMAHGAIMPADMPNVRGILYLLLHGSSRVGPATLVASAGLLLLAAWRCRDRTNLFSLKFSLAAVATILVSYHALGHDLSMLMLPVLLVANESLGKEDIRGWPDILTFAAIAGLFFSPMQLLLLMRSKRLALMGWVVLAMFCGISAQLRLKYRWAGVAV
jgi:hypothetical protein